jgi:hypothetical protein
VNYAVAIVSFQRRQNKKKTKSIKFTFQVLAAIEEQHKVAVGSKVSVEYWADFSKQANAMKIAFLPMACGATDDDMNEFDPDDDQKLLEAVTGIPFVVKTGVETLPPMKREDGTEGKPFTKVDILEARSMVAEKRAKFTKMPDWKEIVGKPESRIEDPFIAKADGSSNYSTTTKSPYDEPKQGNSSSFNDDDSLPF